MKDKFFDSSLISWYIENPLKEYKKIKHFFKPLQKTIRIGKWSKIGGFPISYKSCAKILNITSFSVIWKMKYDTPRHEHDPQITIVLFRKWCIRIRWWYKEEKSNNEDCSMEYWEAALDWIYCNKTLSEAISDNTGWKTYVNNELVDKRYSMLREPYQRLYDNNLLPDYKYGNLCKRRRN